MSYRPVQIMDRPEGTYGFAPGIMQQLSPLMEGVTKGLGDRIYRKAASNAGLTPSFKKDAQGNWLTEYDKPSKDAAFTPEIVEKMINNINNPGGTSTPETGKGKARISKMNMGPFDIEFPKTDEEMQKETDQKANEQSTIAMEKERQLNTSKVSRLSGISDAVEKQWLTTSPRSGVETKFGLTPVLGAMDVLTSNLQANEGQQNDKAYLDFVKGMRAQLARAMGDVGNLSEPEQKAAMNLVPSLLDSKATGQKKLKNLRDFIGTIQETSAKKNTSAYKKAVTNEIGNKTGSNSKAGGQMMTDASGNRAMVYPDGSYEEVK